MRQLKDNNSGLSLIEVLVAMMILTIVVTPFIHSFFTTANANNKAKRIHKATTVAQSVMEGIRAEDVESIAAQFNYPAVNWRMMDNSAINGGLDMADHVAELIYDASEGTYSAAKRYDDIPVTEPDRKSQVTASAYSENGGLDVEFLPNSTGEYYYTIDSLKQDKTSYDVLLKLDANTAAAGYYNSQQLVQLPIFDEKRDAICMEEKAYRENALAACEATDISGLQRTITITVEHTPPSGFGGERVRVLASFYYNKQGDTTKNFTKEITAYDSMESSEELRSIYLYYAPLYPLQASRDTIVYVNNDNVPVNLYVLKQEYDSTAASAYCAMETTNSREVGYLMQLNLRSNTVTQWADCNTRLYTNLAIDMTSGNVIDYPHCTAAFNGTENLDIKRNLTSAEDGTRVFDLSVSIYEEGARAEGFPEDKLLTTIESNKLN